MKIALIAIMMAFSLSVHASCEESEMLSQRISYKLDKETFAKSVRKSYGDRIVDLGFYSDILSDFSREELIDQKIENHFKDQLELSFSCGEIKELSKFSNSDLGKRFFAYYLAAMNSAGNVSLESGFQYLDDFKKKVDERNELILSLLKANPDKFEVEKKEIIVAQGNLKSGTVLDKSNVAIRRVPSEFAGSFMVSPRDAEDILGKKLNRNLKTGDPILIEFVQKI